MVPVASVAVRVGGGGGGGERGDDGRASGEREVGEASGDNVDAGAWSERPVELVSVLNDATQDLKSLKSTMVPFLLER